MQSPVHRWLSLRVRIVCALVFVIGSLLPPYVPRAELSQEMPGTSSQSFIFIDDGFLMKTSTISQQGARLAYNQGIVHTVKDGDSIEKIAQKYGIAPDTLRWANDLGATDILRPGKELVILPVNGVLHTVKRGQTLSRISQLYDIPEEDISRQNKVVDGFIVAGQQLIIPGAKPVGVGRTGIAAVQQPLGFGDSLGGQDVDLKLKSPRAPTAPVGIGAAAQPTAGVLQRPCNNCKMTQGYHPGHYAVDMQTKGGGPVFASEDGEVIRADYGWDGGYGNVIEVDHGNGLVTLYAHNKDLYAKVGDNVKRGQLIAWMGNTGLVYGSTGIHIHFEVRVNGVKKNPVLYLEE